MPSPTIWLITGTSTGLGRALTELVLAKGQIVVATARRTGPLHDLKAKYPADRLLVLKLDVTNSDEITEAFSQVKAAFGRLDVVVNNAAWGTFGEVESAREADARARRMRARCSTRTFGAPRMSRVRQSRSFGR
ncbi:NAD-P-binding protein [Trametes versicolor FP-101664 SS1]|uniref:NAD-P-binding protein n=1 Tax=Trametes versicolor (strain FP-101664) TaxID=717944 RepID=UPI0004624782|nr:NAD-P-binding protein [Trametes versicolor FP-101664 SS1]EIW52298.1 NAD-P-binding protein [Trametes versicolor FP-101664 SS1]